MIRALVRKELRQLLPVIIGLYALMAWEIVDVFLLKPADTHSWGQLSWVLSVDLRSWTAVGELIVALVIAYCLLPGEHAQKTIDFLYTLPIKRRTLFLTKYLVGVGLHIALGLTGTSVLLLRHALNPDSFERRMLAPSHVVYHLEGDIALPLIFVAYGMLLSYFRRLGWILAALYWLAVELAEQISPAFRIFNVKALTTVEHDGLTPIIDGRAWALHAALGAVALVLAARLWLGRGEKFVAFYDRLRASRGLRLS